MANTPHTKRQQQAIARREQLVQTGLRLFSEQGYRATSVRDIARAAGVTEGLLYHYFNSKADLFRAVLDQYAPVRAFGEFLHEAASQHPEQRAFDEALRAFGREFVARIHENRAFLVTMLSEAPNDAELGAILSDFLRATNTDISRFLTEYRQAGQLGALVPIEAAARVLQGSLMFHFLMEALGAPTAPVADETALDDLVTVLLAGLAPR